MSQTFVFSPRVTCLTLKHEAATRAMLADGAVDAARFMVGKGKGLHNMDNILEGK